MLTVKLEAENVLINIICHYSNLSNNSRDMFLVSGAWEQSMSVEIKGSIGSLNKVISEIIFIGRTDYNSNDCSLTILAIDSSDRSDICRIQITVVPYVCYCNNYLQVASTVFKKNYRYLFPNLSYN